VLLVHGGGALLRHGECFVDVGSYDPDKLLSLTDRFLVLGPLSTLASTALVAPRLQLYTHLMCKEVNVGQWDLTNGGATDTRSMGSMPIPCAADPVVQAKVAMFLTSLSFHASDLKPVFYEIRFSHGDGTRHFRLLDNDLLGIGAYSHYSSLTPTLSSSSSPTDTAG
jgi:hypothetical protein